MHIHGGTPLVGTNHIRANHAMGSGGGLRIAGPGGQFVNVVILGNTAGSSGGGVYWEETGTANVPYLLNSTVTGNEAPTGSAITGQSGGARLADNVVAGQWSAPSCGAPPARRRPRCSPTTTCTTAAHRPTKGASTRRAPTATSPPTRCSSENRT